MQTNEFDFPYIPLEARALAQAILAAFIDESRKMEDEMRRDLAAAFSEGRLPEYRVPHRREYSLADRIFSLVEQFDGYRSERIKVLRAEVGRLTGLLPVRFIVPGVPGVKQ